jgi:hypothetical protein
MGKYIDRRAAATNPPKTQKTSKNLPKFFAAVALLAALSPAAAAAADEAPLDSLVLNEGGSLALRVEQDESARF